MKKITTGLASLVLKNYQPNQVEELSFEVEKTLNEYLAIGIKPAVEKDQIWIDFRCSSDTFEELKKEIVKNLEKLKVEVSLTFRE